MAKKLTIRLDTSRYRRPTQQELDAAKRFVLARNDAANAMRDIATDEIEDAAVELVQTAMRYNIPAEQFSFDSSVSEPMMQEVAAVMDKLEEDLMAHLEDYATRAAPDDGSRMLILAFALSLGHRNLGMRDTLHEYLWRTLRQCEALVAAAKAKGLSQSQTISAVRSTLGDVRSSQLLQDMSRYRHLFNAPFINNGGRATFSDGSPNIQGIPVSGLTATVNVLKGAVHRAWEYTHMMEMQQDGAVGYYQFRGSDFPCDLCDEEVGFHPTENPDDWQYVDFPHERCLCGRMPIYRIEELDNATDYGI